MHPVKCSRQCRNHCSDPSQNWWVNGSCYQETRVASKHTS
jgi:hypothetical protein